MIDKELNAVVKYVRKVVKKSSHKHPSGVLMSKDTYKELKAYIKSKNKRETTL